ncbi:hypothetical protein Esti_005324 [Eimeria stiedai]
MVPGARERRPQFVNILKQYPVDDPSRSNQNGDVTSEAIYVQFKPVANRFFVMHFDLSTTKKLPLRITLTNLVKKPKVWARVIQYPLLPPSRWVQVCLHIPSLLGQFTKLCPTGNTLVSIQICSSLYLRGIFTSDVLYTTNDLPRELRLHETFKLRPPELLPWVYVPIGCRSSECNQISCSSSDSSTPEPPDDGDSLGGISGAPPLSENTAGDKAVLADLPNGGQGSLISSGSSGELLTDRRKPATDLFGAGAVLQADRVSGLCRPAQLRRCGAAWVGESRILSCHSSILLYQNLKKKTSRCLLGHTGVIEFLEVVQEAALVATVNNEPCQPSIRIWKLPARGSESEDVRCAAIIQSTTVERICLLRLDPRGRYMVLVGCDRIGRQHLQVWELHGLLTTGRANLLARQVSGFQIEALRISPLEELRIVSCGKENIRFWRIKNAHLPGCNVSLDGLGRNNLFTDIAFSLPCQQTRSPTGADPTTMAKVYVSSACGSLLEIDYFTRTVKRVFPLHQGPVWAVATGLGFCVTASADKSVKVWPLNFVSAYLSAEHEEACVSIDLSPDGQQVLCTCGDSSSTICGNVTSAASMRELYTVCEDGLIRVWTIPDLQQTFEMQSLQDPPLRVAAHPTQRVLAMGFQSGAVRVLAVEGPAVWMEANHHKHPVTGIWFVALPSSAVEAVTPCSQQQQPLQQRSVPSLDGDMACSQSVSMCYLVVSLDASGCICVFSQLHEFALVRVLEEPSSEPPPDGVTALAFAADGSRAARYLSSRKLGIIRLPKFNFEEELCPLATVCRSVVITAFSFSAAADALCVCGSDSIMRLFTILQEVRLSFLLLREVALLSGPISTAWISSAESNSSVFPAVALTCGADSLVKVWNIASVRGAERQTGTPQVGKSGDERHETMKANSFAEAEQARTISRALQAATSSPVAAGCRSPEFPAFQSFAGHHQPAFMLQLLGDYLLSISPTETITWRVNSPLLSAAADVAPLSCSTVLPSHQQTGACSRLIPESALQCRTHHTQQSLQLAQSSRSQLPQSSPTQNPQQRSPRWESESHKYPNEDSLDSPRTLSPPKRATLPPLTVMYKAKPTLPLSVPDGGGDDILGSNVARSAEPAEYRDPGMTIALVPPAPATDEAPTKVPAAQSSASHGMVAGETGVSQRPASADPKYTARHSSPKTKVLGGKGDEETRAFADTPRAQVFPRTDECSAVIDSSQEQEQTLAILNQHEARNSQLHCLLRSAAARHVVGTSVTECRNNCFWRPSNGVLAHAVGKWIVVEKLAARSPSQEGRCLGLLPALLEAKILTMYQPGEASTAVLMRTASSSPCSKRMLQQQQLQLLQQSAMLAHKPPAAVLSHPLVGRPIAFSLDTTARLAATISEMTVTQGWTPCRCVVESSGLCDLAGVGKSGEKWEDDVITCWGLCVWKTEGAGELLGVARLPRGYGEGKALHFGKRACLHRNAENASINFPGVLFCGSDLIVTAGGLDEGRLDVWRVSDFLSAPNCMLMETEPASLVDTSTPKASAASGVCEGCCTRSRGRGRPIEQLRGGPTPAVGAEVGTPLKRLLSAASGKEREVVFVSPRSVTLWRVVRGDSSPLKSRSRSQRLQLQFQFAEQPRRLLSDQLENYSTACFTRRDKGNSRLLLVASDKGWVYGYDYDANIFVFELQVDDNPIGSISCGKALYLAFTTNCVARRTTVDLQRILETQRALGPQTVDLRLKAAAPSLTLDGPIRTLQLDAGAQEAMSLRYLHWDQRAQVRLHSSHKLPIRRLAVSSQASHKKPQPGTTKGVRMPSASRSRLSATGPLSDTEPLLLATADDGGSLRIWSRWPVPQQVADFSLQHSCTALSFLQPTLLLGCFTDGALRLFDTRTFRVAGRLQLSVPHDPPVAIACLSDLHVLLATASGEVLSLILDIILRPADDARTAAGPEIKHASISKITNAVLACFGPASVLKKTRPFGDSCSSCSDCVSGAKNTLSSTSQPVVVECLVGQRKAANASSKGERVIFALCLSGGYCSVGAYAKACGDNRWMLCSASCFGVRFGSESLDHAPPAKQEAMCRACFFAGDKLLVSRGNALFLVDCTAQQVTRQVNLSAALDLANCQARGALSVASICCPRDDTAVIITQYGEMLLVEAFTLRLAGVVHHGIHPHLPRTNAAGRASPICLTACAEYEVALACDCSVSLVHVF